MAEETNNKELPAIAQPKIRAFTTPKEGLYETYSNYINVNWGVFDVRIRFAQLIPVSGEAEAAGQAPERVVEERAAVTLAWAEVVILRNFLNECIEKYERTNGELKVPDLPR